MIKNVIVPSFLWICIVWQFHNSKTTPVSMSLYSDEDCSRSFRSLNGWENPRLGLGFSRRHLASVKHFPDVSYIGPEHDNKPFLLLVCNYEDWNDMSFKITFSIIWSKPFRRIAGDYRWNDVCCRQTFIHKTWYQILPMFVSSSRAKNKQLSQGYHQLLSEELE